MFNVPRSIPLLFCEVRYKESLWRSCMNPDRVTNNQSVELSVRGLMDNIYKELVIWHTGCKSPCQLVSLCKLVQMNTLGSLPAGAAAAGCSVTLMQESPW